MLGDDAKMSTKDDMDYGHMIGPSALSMHAGEWLRCGYWKGSEE